MYLSDAEMAAIDAMIPRVMTPSATNLDDQRVALLRLHADATARRAAGIPVTQLVEHVHALEQAIDQMRSFMGEKLYCGHADSRDGHCEQCWPRWVDNAEHWAIEAAHSAHILMRLTGELE